MRDPHPLLGAYSKDIWTGPEFHHVFPAGPQKSVERRAPAVRVAPKSVRPVREHFLPSYAQRGLMPLLQEKRKLYKFSENEAVDSTGPHGTHLDNDVRKVKKVKAGSKEGKRSGIPIL